MKQIVRRLALAGPVLALLAAALPPVFAQPWGERGQRWDAPRYQERAYSGPPSQSRHPRCRQLEDQLAGGWTQGNVQEQLPKLDANIERLTRDVRRLEAEANRADCYEDMFIFGRSLRRTRVCVDLDRNINDSRAQLAALRAERDAIARSSDRRGRQEQILAELARFNCGEAYVREYRARTRIPSIFDLWTDEDSDDRGSPYPSNALPYESYRTLCVRLCDGFFFPVSYSTLPSRFAEDEARCKSQCAAPVELFTHRTADQDAEQAVSLSGRPYTSLPTAFRHRQFYTRGCSCNASEYSPEEIAKSEEEFRNRTAAASRPAAPAASAPPAADPNAGAPATGQPAAPEAAPQTETGTVSGNRQGAAGAAGDPQTVAREEAAGPRTQ